MDNGTMQTDERTALYYPYLVPTDNLWIKQTLLYWDRIGSIIPEQARSMPGLFTNDLAYLESAGIFTSADYTYFSYLINPDYVIEDIKQILTDSKFPAIKKRFFKSHGIQEQNYDSCVTAIYEDKFTSYIVKELQNLGIDIIYEDMLGQYMMGMVEAGIYMSILSKHISSSASSTTVPVTDSPAMRDLLYYNSSLSNQSGILGMNLVLENIFPSPGEDVSFADILDFKYKRREELTQFRSVMDKYYRKLSCVRYADELVMASNDIVDEIEVAVKSLTNAMKDARQTII